jgi:D-alanyl-D-alanine carboxypeptidase
MPTSRIPTARIPSRLLAALAVGTLALVFLATLRPATASDEDLAEALAGLIEQAAAVPQDPPSAILLVVAPRLGLDWIGAAPGPGRDEAMPPRADGTLRIASNTKTYVAAAVLRLVEDGKLELDVPVERVLLPATVATLRDGGYRPDAITVRMLLQHTSGVYDYASDESFIARVMQEPGRRWTRAEQVEWAMSAGAPYGVPGEVFHYGDTGYILLGEVLEVTTAQPMPAAMRSLLGFERLGLRATWFETLEPEPEGVPARSLQRSEGMDVALIDASVDLFGGGGLVSTLPEVARFYRALLQGEVFREASTLATMLEPSPQSLASGGDGYGMGLGRLRLPGGVDCYGHAGFWGTEAWHCPGVDVTVVGAVTESAAPEALQYMTRRALEQGVAELAARE